METKNWSFSESANSKGVLRINIDGIVNGRDRGLSCKISPSNFEDCRRLFGDSREAVIQRSKDILIELYLRVANYGN